MGFKMVRMMDEFMCMCMFVSSLACMLAEYICSMFLDVMASLVICHANLCQAR